MKVLVIDDDTWQLDIFERELIKAGHTVVTSVSAYDAVAELDALPPDVILLDLMLPGSNGIALLNEIRSYDDLAQVPVIVISGTQLDPKALMPYGVKYMLDKAKILPGDVQAVVKAAVHGD